MTANDLIDALELPSETRLDQRVAKKLLVEHAPTSADKKAINEGIEEVVWVAALKPSLVGVPPYEDPERQYLEIAVLTLTLRDGAKTARLQELVHRAIPYPVVLVTTEARGLTFSMCEIRHSHGEAGKTVLDGEVQAAPVSNDEIGRTFRETLALRGLPNGNLRLLYQGWLDRLTSLEAAGILGKWPGPGSSSQRREAVDAIREIDTKLIRLRRLAETDTQLARRVELNLEIQHLRTERGRLLDLLG